MSNIGQSRDRRRHSKHKHKHSKDKYPIKEKDKLDVVRLKHLANAKPPREKTLYYGARYFYHTHVHHPKRSEPFLEQLKFILTFPDFGEQLITILRDDPETIISLALTCRNCYCFLKKIGWYKKAWLAITKEISQNKKWMKTIKHRNKSRCLDKKTLTPNNFDHKIKRVREHYGSNSDDEWELKQWLETCYGENVWDDLF